MSTRILPWLRLCRFPAVFTALPDIVLGFLLSHVTLAPQRDFWPLLGASAGLYLAGMVFNDVFDLRQDARERPQRPLPSGAVSLRAAVGFGLTLLSIGLTCAWLAGPHSFSISLILTGCILGYDAILKRTPLGPVAMGACRFFNVLLGASNSGERFAAAWQMPQLWVAAALGIYIVGVTWFARSEARTSRRVSLIGGLVVANFGLAMLAAWITNWAIKFGVYPGYLVTNSTPPLLLWGVIVLTINRRAIAAVIDPVPKKVQPTIGTMLLSVIVLDALLIWYKLGPTGVPYAIAVVLLLIPAILLRKAISLT